MRILWYTNVVLPEVAQAAHLEGQYSAGWIQGFWNGIMTKPSIELTICCPYTTQILLSGQGKGFAYYVTPESFDKYDDILNASKPDIVHVFGTESPEALKLVKAFNRPERTVINIQGMLNLYADVFFEGLPHQMSRRTRVFEKVIHNSLIDQRNNMRYRATTEAEMLRLAGHAIGRTDIDHMFCQSHNADIRYHHCDEILRSDFWKRGGWNVKEVRRHSILFRSTATPIKGLHMMLQAMPILLKKYPNTHLYVIGTPIFQPASLKGKFVEGSYNKYVRQQIETAHLTGHITFLGTLSAQQMKDEYLKANVFVSASQIENESNVISEAKMLGVPCVASFVGGLPNRITHGKDGFLYPYNMPSMLAYYVERLFEDDQLCTAISQEAIRSQSIINDPETNKEKLFAIYKEIKKG